MNRRTAISLAAAALPAAACARAAGPDDEAAEWRALRGVRGHFEGGAFNEAVDRWQGRKHVLMQQLAQALLAERASAAQLRARMGEPDAVLDARAPAQARLLQRAADAAVPPGALAQRGAARPEALWLYRWRGARDQLAFALTADRVVATAWLYEWE